MLRCLGLLPAQFVHCGIPQDLKGALEQGHSLWHPHLRSDGAQRVEESLGNPLLLWVCFNPVAVWIRYFHSTNVLAIPVFKECQSLFLESCFSAMPWHLLTAWFKVCVWVSRVSKKIQMSAMSNNLIPELPLGQWLQQRKWNLPPSCWDLQCSRYSWVRIETMGHPPEFWNALHHHHYPGLSSGNEEILS